VLQEAGLSHVQLRLLYSLKYSTLPLSLSELARRLGCGKSNVAQLLDRMQKENLVRRVPDEQDRRQRYAVVTEEGQRRLLDALLAVSAAAPRILGALENPDRDELARLLAKSLAERSRDALRTWSRVVEATKTNVR
jgi:DNA-binding MarR family transcriptional regulator